jgi:class I fructose-bisphosphate aldolase
MANTTINVKEVLGADAEALLGYSKTAVSKDRLHLPGPDFVDRIVASTDRNQAVLNNWQRILNTGRLGGTGYVSILPVDQGIEHSAGASFAPNPDYFDADKIIELAIEGGCNAVASTYGVLGMTARKWAHKIPYLVKFNHNELMTYPNTFNQIPFGTIRQCWDMGAAAVGATIYFGSEESGEQIQYVADMFAEAHELGMVTVLWCYLRNNKFKVDGVDYHTAADLTAQANHLGAPSRPTSSSRSSPRSTAGSPRSTPATRPTASSTRRSTPTSPAATRTARAATPSTSAATSSSTSTWAASPSSTRAAQSPARAT